MFSNGEIKFAPYVEGKVDGDGDEGEFEDRRLEKLPAVARNVVKHRFQPARLFV